MYWISVFQSGIVLQSFFDFHDLGSLLMTAGGLFCRMSLGLGVFDVSWLDSGYASLDWLELVALGGVSGKQKSVLSLRSIR